MSATRYKVWAWGRELNRGVTDACYVALTTVAKKASEHSPYIVANELVCGAIAQCLVLPCPPGVLFDKDGECWYGSLSFNLSGESLPPVNPQTVATKFPRLSWGIILFDLLMMNGDRSDENLAYDEHTDRVQIFDHSHAFAQDGGDITQFLAADHDAQFIRNHCLAQEICEHDGIEHWLGKIKQIPDFLFEDTIGAATEAGLPSDKRAECVDFFKRRRSNLGKILESHMGCFPRLPTVAT